jgi:hypothetical protein
LLSILNSVRRASNAAIMTAGLIYPFAVLVHAVVHLVGSELPVGLSVPHVLMLVSALATLAAGGRSIGIGAGTWERRRRVALVRADLRRFSLPSLGIIVVAEAALAAALLALEGAALDAHRLLPAILAGLLTLVLSAAFVRCTGERIASVVAWRPPAVRAGAPSLSAFRYRAQPLGAGRRALLRRLAFRAPPGRFAFS